MVMFLEDSEDVILFSVFGAVITLVILVVMIAAVIVYWRQKAHAHGVWPQVQHQATSLTTPQYVWFIQYKFN